jgi:hypothetical protein
MILKLFALALLLFAIGMSTLWVRSTIRDEGLSWESKRVTKELATVDRQLEVAWGPHGLRFWVWFDSCPVDEMFRDITTPSFQSGFDWKSEPFEKGVSWGWPEKTFWNRRGFWLSRQEYHWDGGHHRKLFLVATPFWTLVLGALAGVSAIIWKQKRKRNLTMRCSEPGMASWLAIGASRGPGR